MADLDVAFTTLDASTGERFQRLRDELRVQGFGINLITLKPGERGRIHLHSVQEEVYLVLGGELTLVVEGDEHVLVKHRIARVGPNVRRQLINYSAEPTAILALGGSGEHQGGDARAWESWTEEGEGRSPKDVPTPKDTTHR